MRSYLKTKKEEELRELLEKFEEEGRIKDYNRLKTLLDDEHIEIIDILHKEDKIEVFCNDNFEEVPFIEIFIL